MSEIDPPVQDPPHGTMWRNVTALALCGFATSAMIGDLLGSREIKGIGVLSAIAPFPKVFCAVEGVEGFACDFAVHYEQAGETRSLPITPESYSGLAGPYNRRNVYGAALAGGLWLPRSLWEPVFEFAFATNGPLRTEMGVPADAANVRVRVQSRTRGRDDAWMLQPEP